MIFNIIFNLNNPSLPSPLTGEMVKGFHLKTSHFPRIRHWPMSHAGRLKIQLTGAGLIA